MRHGTVRRLIKKWLQEVVIEYVTAVLEGCPSVSPTATKQVVQYLTKGGVSPH